MVDPILPLSAPAGSFDTTLMQISRAQAQARTTNTDVTALLLKTAEANDETNAQPLTGSNQAEDVFATDDLFSGKPSEEIIIDPAVDPATLTAINQLDTAPTTEAAIKAQQLRNMAVLQRDTELLEEAVNVVPPTPLGDAASTVDLSPQVQAVANGESTAPSAPLTSEQLLQVSQVLQPLANEPLTPTLLEQIKVQLLAAQNPVQLSISMISSVMNYIASLQVASNPAPVSMPNFSAGKTVSAVAPIAPVDEVMIEDNLIR